MESTAWSETVPSEQYSGYFTNSGVYALARSSYTARSRNGFRNKLWKESIAKRSNASSPYSRTDVILEQIPCHFYNKTNPAVTGQYFLDHSHSGVPINNKSGEYASVDYRAKEKARAQLHNRIGDYNLLPGMAEAHKLLSTHSQIRSLLYEWLLSYAYIRKTKPAFKAKGAAAAAQTRMLSQMWLMYSFALKPLIADFEGTVRAFVVIEQNDGVNAIPFAGMQYKDFPLSDPTERIPTGNVPAGGFTVCSLRSGHVRYSVRYRGSYLPKLRKTDLEGVLNVLGISWNNVPSAAWELFPFSWVVDYYTNIGTILGDARIYEDGDIIYLDKTVSSEEFIQVETWIKPYIYNTYIQTPGRTGFYNRTVRNFSRSKVSIFDFNTPQLRWKDMPEINAHADNKLLNLLSVIGARFGIPQSSRFR